MRLFPEKIGQHLPPILTSREIVEQRVYWENKGHYTRELGVQNRNKTAKGHQTLEHKVDLHLGQCGVGSSGAIPEDQHAGIQVQGRDES